MSDEEVKSLVKRYRMDSGITYELSAQELQVLLAEVGEEEPIVDAINVLNGVSIEQRAKDIGCRVDDFLGRDDNDIISVKNLDLWSAGLS